jgi:hypothetical protein
MNLCQCRSGLPGATGEHCAQKRAPTNAFEMGPALSSRDLIGSLGRGVLTHARLWEKSVGTLSAVSDTVWGLN